MSRIIPYYEGLEKGGGAFITPEGKILPLNDNKHIEFAEAYCNGRDYEIYTGAKFGPPLPTIKRMIAEKEVREAKNGIDIFRSSNLSKVQLEEYRKWLEMNKIDGQQYCVDFLVYVLAFDKVETLVRNLITTTSVEPHIRFYNYYLMDWNINVQSRLVYDKDNRMYHFIEDVYSFSDYEDREAEEEINEIKSKILVKDRPYFFKD